MALEELTHKQRLFVEAYVGVANGNGTAAAVVAGYPESSARIIASQNLTKLNIKAAIAARYAEAAMPADEVLARLGQQARNEASRFFRVDGQRLFVDLNGLRDAGLMHLVKGVRETQHGQQIEFLDPQAALLQVGRHLKLFTDRQESDVNLSVEEAAESLDRKLGGIVAALNAGGGPGQPDGAGEGGT